MTIDDWIVFWLWFGRIGGVAFAAILLWLVWRTFE